MGKRTLHMLVFFVENLGAGVWIGALAGFGFAVAGSVFQEAPSITVAGNINAVILAKLNRLEGMAAACMGFGAVYFVLHPAERTWLRVGKAALWLLMLAGLLMYAGPIADRLEYLRTVEIQDFDNFDPARQVFRDEFARLHARYTQLVSVNLLLGLGFVFLSACERRD